MKEADPRLFQFAGFRLDPREKILLAKGVRLALAPRVFDTLLLLVRRHGHLVEKDEFLSTLWSGTVVSDGALTQCVSLLRKTLGDEPRAPAFIETAAKRGYRFIAPVSELRIASRSVAPARPSEPGSATAPAVAAPHTIRSLAVLPFESLSGDPAQEYFADGITDELITRVAGIRELRVSSRTSSMVYKGARKSAAQIGRELGVDALLEGTLQRDGQRLRLRAQLIHAASDSHCWAKTYDRKSSDVLALQSELARDVARQIQARVSPAP
jgi:TolB-like protein